MEFDFRKLLGRIVEKYGSRAAFCEAEGFSRSGLSYKLNNRTKFTPDEIYHMMQPECLDIPSEEVGLYFFTPKVRETEQPHT